MFFDYQYFSQLKKVDDLDFFVKRVGGYSDGRDMYVFDANGFEQWYHNLYDSMYLPFEVSFLFTQGFMQYCSGFFIEFSILFKELGVDSSVSVPFDLFLTDSCFFDVIDMCRKGNAILIDDVLRSVNCGNFSCYMPLEEHVGYVGFDDFYLCKVNCNNFICYLFVGKTSNIRLLVAVCPKISPESAFRSILKDSFVGKYVPAEGIDLFIDSKRVSIVLQKTEDVVIDIFNERRCVVEIGGKYMIPCVDLFVYALCDGCDDFVFERLRDYVIRSLEGGYAFDSECEGRIFFSKDIDGFKFKIKELVKENECLKSELLKIKSRKSFLKDDKTLEGCVVAVSHFSKKFENDSKKSKVTQNEFLSFVSKESGEVNDYLAKKIFKLLPHEMRAGKGEYNRSNNK
jgi:hypothetical protein